MEDKKLKIGLFIDSFFPMVDGVIMVVDNYARRLSKFCDVTVFTLKPRAKDPKPRNLPYKVVRCKSAKFLNLDYDIPLPKLDKNFKKALKESNLDIVHIHSPFTVGRMGVKYAKKHNIPAVATMHSQFKQDFLRSTKSKLLTKFLLHKIMKVFNACDEYYGVNPKTSEIFLEYGAKHLPLVQRNGTDMTPIENKKEALERVNKKFGISQNVPVFLFVGRMNKLKNIYFILEALQKLKTKDFKMIFVGDGQDFDEFKKQVEKSKIADKVILAGKVTDRDFLSAIYMRADLFLFPSKYDTNGLVQIEAASQGTPTVFLENTGASSTITDNVNGFVAQDSPEKFAEKIDQILADDKLYQKVKEGAVRDLYVTWDECVKEMHEKYLFQIDRKQQ